MLTLLLACAASQNADGDVVDLVVTHPAAPEQGFQVLGPELEIPPYSEIQYCWTANYDGPDVGITRLDPHQSEHGHHATLMRSTYSSSEHPAGETFDCTAADSIDMTRAPPVFLLENADTGYNSLPEGMALNWESGQTYILQSHYINTTAETVRVQDAINVGTIPAEEVEIWASVIGATDLGLKLPPGEFTTIEKDCTWKQDFNLASLAGHMHEWGEQLSVDYIAPDVEERLYDLEWKTEYRDDPVTLDWFDDPMQIEKGDTFTLSCTWYNDTDEELGFPEEMCAAFGIGYPLRDPLYCL